MSRDPHESDRRTVLASITDAGRDELVSWARDAVGEMQEGDTAGVVVFGGTALVDRLPSNLRELSDPGSRPVAGATDVAAAVRLAEAIMPAGTQQRLVLLDRLYNLYSCKF